MGSEQPGQVVLFGSGESSASGRATYEWAFRQLAPPIQVAILETPAGFELNSPLVAQRVADFLALRLQNYHPQTTIVPARRRGTPFSPDDPAMLALLRPANVLFMGAGSPTYAVRQLEGSLVWQALRARHHLGATAIFASAAVAAIGRYALPVYEIYKVGDDLHWRNGLDFFGAFGLALVFIPHWNNTDGGTELDTSRCWMGQPRFAALRAMLDPSLTVVGIDEHTALAIDLAAGSAHVLGRGGVTVLAPGGDTTFASGATFPLTCLGPFQLPTGKTNQDGIPDPIWAAMRPTGPTPSPKPPAAVLALVQEREAARARRDWPTADALRNRIAGHGWQVNDTPSGPDLVPLPS